MQIIRSLSELEEMRSDVRSSKATLGFVPTMGALHDGHLSLVRTSQSENDLTICSVFVNPTQFTDPLDFEKYPRQLKSDAALLEQSGCHFLFTPSVSLMYPQKDETAYNLGRIMDVLEGEFRPGHFNGVASVVRRLFSLIQPDKAYFGLKDYQQLQVIRAMVEKYDLPLQLRGCPIKRAESGLALSSRNALLSENGKELASSIYAALSKVQDAYGKVPVSQLAEIGKAHLQSIEGIQTEYFEVVDHQSLEVLKNNNSLRQKAVALVAARVENVRLIDNIELIPPET